MRRRVWDTEAGGRRIGLLRADSKLGVTEDRAPSE